MSCTVRKGDASRCHRMHYTIRQDHASWYVVARSPLPWALQCATLLPMFAIPAAPLTQYTRLRPEAATGGCSACSSVVWLRASICEEGGRSRPVRGKWGQVTV
eukprot:328600-Chlamydomonas_euryale.AAC.1